jgi:hypothetical protein
VAGQTYPWDFFFCERHTTQSHLRISTDLNLQTRTAFTVKDTVDYRQRATVVFTIHGSRPGQGCASDSAVPPSVKYVLSGSRALPLPQVLGGGTSYGGITVDPAFGSVKIDTSKMVGLPAGHYQLRVSASGDSTIFQDFWTSPFPGSRSRLRRNQASLRRSGRHGALGARHRTLSGHALSSGKSIPFAIHAVPGLSLCRDSLCARPLAAATP